MTDPEQPHVNKCETCHMDLSGVSYYKGVYASAGPGPPSEKWFCSIPCLTKHTYNNTETVELPGGNATEMVECVLCGKEGEKEDLSQHMELMHGG